MEDKIRCFVSIEPPRKIINEIERVQKELRKKNLFHGKFTEGENLHLTLKFFGEIGGEQVEEIKRKLRGIKFPAFQAYLGEFGVFSSDHVRIIWTHILGKKIEDLQKIIDVGLKDFFRSDEQFVSHLTVARVKNVKDKKLLLDALKEIRVQNIGFDIKEFYLMKSELKEEGPVYDILEKFELK